MPTTITKTKYQQWIDKCARLIIAAQDYLEVTEFVSGVGPERDALLEAIKCAKKED